MNNQEKLNQLSYYIRQKTINYFVDFKNIIDSLSIEEVKNYKNNLNQDLIEYSILYEQAMMVNYLIKIINPDKEKMLNYLNKNFERNNSTLKVILDNIKNENKGEIFNLIKDKINTIKRRENIKTLNDYFSGNYSTEENLATYHQMEEILHQNTKKEPLKLNNDSFNSTTEKEKKEVKTTIIIKKKRKLENV